MLVLRDASDWSPPCWLFALIGHFWYGVLYWYQAICAKCIPRFACETGHPLSPWQVVRVLESFGKLLGAVYWCWNDQWTSSNRLRIQKFSPVGCHPGLLKIQFDPKQPKLQEEGVLDPLVWRKECWQTNLPHYQGSQDFLGIGTLWNSGRQVNGTRSHCSCLVFLSNRTLRQISLEYQNPKGPDILGTSTKNLSVSPKAVACQNTGCRGYHDP